MQAAAQAGLYLVGLTDHDTVSGWDEAAAAVPSSGVALLRGTEVSCTWQGITVHMLSYLHDPTDADLLALFSKIRSSREQRARLMVERLAKDFPITYQDVCALAPKGGPVGRPHMADALVNAGCFADRSQAFSQVLHPKHHYYVKLWSPDPIDVIRASRKAGGVPVFAHPRAAKRQRFFVPYRAIKQMRNEGLFGIEVNHRDHSAEWRAQVRSIAQHLDLSMFGSSDYHGDGKPNRLGENLTDPQVIARLAEQGKMEVIYP